MIGVDWIAGLPTTAAGFDMIRNHVDLLSGKVHAVPTRSTETTADTAAIIRDDMPGLRQGLGLRQQQQGRLGRPPAAHRVRHQKRGVDARRRPEALLRRPWRAPSAHVTVVAACRSLSCAGQEGEHEALRWSTAGWCVASCATWPGCDGGATRRQTMSGCGQRSWRTARRRWRGTTPRPHAAARPAGLYRRWSRLRNHPPLRPRPRRSSCPGHPPVSGSLPRPRALQGRPS
jgi:hypothetical protein